MKTEEDKIICPDCGEEMSAKENVSFEEITYKVGEKNFESLWKSNKEEFKRMSKKELAETMFKYGIEHVITGMYAITNKKREN